MNLQQALNDLYIKKTHIKLQSPYDPKSQEGIELGNRIEVIIDRAAMDVSTMYRLGYELGQGLSPTLAEMKDEKFLHIYESMGRHIERCRKAVRDAKEFIALRKESKS